MQKNSDYSALKCPESPSATQLLKHLLIGFGSNQGVWTCLSVCLSVGRADLIWGIEPEGRLTILGHKNSAATEIVGGWISNPESDNYTFPLSPSIHQSPFLFSFNSEGVLIERMDALEGLFFDSPHHHQGPLTFECQITAKMGVQPTWLPSVLNLLRSTNGSA